MPEFDHALELASSGQRVVVVAESTNGSALPLIDRLPPELGQVSRVMCVPASRTRVGGVAEDLGLDSFGGGTLIVEDAQWADPTSLGRLQRLVKQTAQRLLLILAHRPVSDVDGWWLDSLAAAAGRDATLVQISLETSEADSPDLDSDSTDLVLAAGLVPGAISVPVAARLLERPEPEVLELAEGLVRAGWLSETRGGFVSAARAMGIEVGEARAGYLAGRLATAMEDMGGDPAVVGALRLSAGQPDLAFPLLSEAALRARDRRAGGEAFHLAEEAIHAAEEAGLDDRALLGELHLVCGQFLRSAGRSDWAASHLDQATRLLEGEARIDALGFAAAVADDRQHPQEAERTLAVAEWEAASQGETAKLGSLLTFRARALNRIGFAAEADAVLEKGLGILDEESSSAQRFYANLNQAWIHFDRGEAAKAEMVFTRLRDEAGALEGEASVADKEAWRARALFASGHPSDALGAVVRAEELAGRHEVEAPLFLADLALTEGNLLFGRYDDALAASERALDLVERQLPAWENMVRSHRAHALLRMGRIDEARAEIGLALELTPPGANGWRWRTRCRALQMEIAAEAGERWPGQEAEDLADHMLQSGLYGWAAELYSVIAERGKNAAAARDALGLAVQVGNPMLAARAARAGPLWKDPLAAPAIRAVRAVQGRLPPGWEEDWLALPAVSQALAAPEPADEEDTGAVVEALEEGLRRAGLAGDVVLSPAQRRSQGLVRRHRRLRPLRVAAAALGVVVLAAGTAFGVAELTRTDPPPVATPTTVPATTLPPGPHEIELDLPDDILQLFGRVEHRGGPGRTGYIGHEGPLRADGFYWRYDAGARIAVSAVTEGQWLYVASTDGVLHAITQVDGQPAWTMPTGSGIQAAPALGQIVQEGNPEPLIVVGDTAGVVHGRDSRQRAAVSWISDLGAAILSSPLVVEGSAWVATTDGFVYELSLDRQGDVVWRYPEEGDEGIGRVTADLAYDNGFLYVGSESGSLHVIDVQALQGCELPLDAPIRINPVVTADLVYVFTVTNSVFAVSPGTCDAPRTPLAVFFGEDPMEVAPAIHEEVIYLPFGRNLQAINLEMLGTPFEGGEAPPGYYVWPAETVMLDSDITTPPVVAENMILFGSLDGTVYAVERESGNERWMWRPTGRRVWGAPAVIEADGISVVYIVTGDGLVCAVGDGTRE